MLIVSNTIYGDYDYLLTINYSSLGERCFALNATFCHNLNKGSKMQAINPVCLAFAPPCSTIPYRHYTSYSSAITESNHVAKGAEDVNIRR
jgi:hypothetical protein